MWADLHVPDYQQKQHQHGKVLPVVPAKRQADGQHSPRPRSFVVVPGPPAHHHHQWSPASNGPFSHSKPRDSSSSQGFVRPPRPLEPPPNSVQAARLARFEPSRPPLPVVKGRPAAAFIELTDTEGADSDVIIVDKPKRVKPAPIEPIAPRQKVAPPQPSAASTSTSVSASSVTSKEARKIKARRPPPVPQPELKRLPQALAQLPIDMREARFALREFIIRYAASLPGQKGSKFAKKQLSAHLDPVGQFWSRHDKGADTVLRSFCSVLKDDLRTPRKRQDQFKSVVKQIDSRQGQNEAWSLAFEILESTESSWVPVPASWTETDSDDEAVITRSGSLASASASLKLAVLCGLMEQLASTAWLHKAITAGHDEEAALRGQLTKERASIRAYGKERVTDLDKQKFETIAALPEATVEHADARDKAIRNFVELRETMERETERGVLKLKHDLFWLQMSYRNRFASIGRDQTGNQYYILTPLKEGSPAGSLVNSVLVRAVRRSSGTATSSERAPPSGQIERTFALMPVSTKWRQIDNVADVEKLITWIDWQKRDEQWDVENHGKGRAEIVDTSELISTLRSFVDYLKYQQTEA